VTLIPIAIDILVSARVTGIRRLVTVATAVLLLLLPGGCHSQKTHTVLYINSYHPGYGSSDDVMAGVQETLAGRRVRLTTAWINPVLAGQIGFEPKPELAGRCRRVE
jgi:hypothetical protein